MHSAMLRAPVRSFARPATWRHRNSTPVTGSRHACEISFLQVLTTQANRNVWPTKRAFFPNISVCLGERRGQKEISSSRERNVPAPLRSPKRMNDKGIIDEQVDRCQTAEAVRR